MIAKWIKIVYTAYVGFLVPAYWQQHGPENFLWFSDIALLVMVPALWLENRLLTSMMALSVLLPEIVWSMDFFFRLLTGIKLFGFNSYMFDPQIPLWIRGLSLFHAVLPILLVWTLWRIGYNRRALAYQTILGAVVLLSSYGVSDPRANVNLVYGFGQEPQTLMPGFLFPFFLWLMLFLIVYWPTHVMLKRLFTKAE